MGWVLVCVEKGDGWRCMGWVLVCVEKGEARPI